MRPTTPTAGRDEGGFATAEFVAAFGLLLIPTLLFVLAIMQWPRMAAMANTAASEAAREVVVKQSPNAPNRDAVALVAARETADQFAAGGGAAVRDARVSIVGCTRVNCRGAEVTVVVDVELPVLMVPFVGQMAPSYTYSAHATERVEDYRGF